MINTTNALIKAASFHRANGNIELANKFEAKANKRNEKIIKVSRANATIRSAKKDIEVINNCENNYFNNGSMKKGAIKRIEKLKADIKKAEKVIATCA